MSGKKNHIQLKKKVACQVQRTAQEGESYCKKGRFPLRNILCLAKTEKHIWKKKEADRAKKKKKTFGIKGPL